MHRNFVNQLVYDRLYAIPPYTMGKLNNQQYGLMLLFSFLMQFLDSVGAETESVIINDEEEREFSS